MEITELHGPRFDLAIERFRDGHPFTFEGVGFRLASDGALEMAIQTTWRPENLTEQTALRDLERTSNVADALIAASPEFASFVSGRPRLSILIDDYGMGAVELCRLTGGSLVWKLRPPVRANAT